MTKTNTHKRQALWCDLCKQASIMPGEEYTLIGGGNACQDCVPIAPGAKAGAHG